MAVNFYIDKRTDKKGDAPIRMSINIKGVRYLSSTGLKVNPAKWDTARQQAKKGCSNSSGMTWSAINAYLSKINEYFTAYEGDCISSGLNPDINTLKMEFSRVFGRTRKSTDRSGFQPGFFDYMDAFVKESGTANSWVHATSQKFKTLKNHLMAFNSELEFPDLTEGGISDFISFLRVSRGMRNVTIEKSWKLLKWFLKWASAKGYNTNTDYLKYSPKLKSVPKKVIFLEWNELMKVFNYEIPENGTVVTLKDAQGKEYTKTVHDAAAIAKTRDIFCFCCFTSLRYSDVSNLKKTDFHGDSFTITTLKTADTVTIELNKYASAIMERYADRENPGGFVFPHITNQRMNIYLKDLCEFCEINQPITQTYYIGAERFDETSPKFELIGTHAGRRTFICNALMLGIPAEIVMKWTGHSDYKAMKPYIDIANSAKAKAMSKFNEI